MSVFDQLGPHPTVPTAREVAPGRPRKEHRQQLKAQVLDEQRQRAADLIQGERNNPVATRLAREQQRAADRTEFLAAIGHSDRVPPQVVMTSAELEKLATLFCVAREKMRDKAAQLAGVHVAHAEQTEGLIRDFLHQAVASLGTIDFRSMIQKTILETAPAIEAAAERGARDKRLEHDLQPAG